MFDHLLWNHQVYHLLWFFVIYSFLGWCVEVAAHAVTLRKFVNRGFLTGATCPIYGFGMILVIILLTPIKDNILFLFLGSILLTTGLEFVTGFVLEKLFRTRWWDYSKEKFNIKGYICLKYSLLWGLACVVIMKLIHPLITGVIDVFPQLLGQILISILILGTVADFVTVVIGLTKMNKKIKVAMNLKTRIQNSSDTIGEKITEDVLELQNLIDELPDKRGYIHKRLTNAFPPLSKVDLECSKEQLKNELKKLVK